MNVKQLKEKVAALPNSLDNAEVYTYVDIGEDAASAYNVKVFDQDSFDDEGFAETPYCKGDAPWDISPDGKIKPWKGTPAFVIIG